MLGAESLRESADKMLATLLKQGEESKNIRRYIFRLVSPKVFRDEPYVLYRLLYRLRDKNITIDREFIELALLNNKKFFKECKGYLDIQDFGDIDGNYEDAYIAGVLKYFDKLSTMPPLSQDDFELCFEKYVIEFKRVEMGKALRESNAILSEGLKIGRNEYAGYEDSVSYIKKRSAEIDGLVDLNNGKGFRTMQEVLTDSEEDLSSEKVSDFGLIDELNESFGGIYSGMMYLVLAPPKAGKSKFATRIAHTAQVKYGQNVTVWAVEGGSAAWLAQERAIHFDYMYNDGVEVADKKFGVDQFAVLRGNLDSELASLEETSRLDLQENPEYGKVNFIDRPFYVETFIEELDKSVRSNGSSMIIIDYLQLIDSTGTKLSERERIAKAFPKLLKYIKDNNLAAVLPAQYSQESVKDMLKASDVSKMDSRVLGGGSSEMVKSTDYIIPLFATTEDIRNHRMIILPTTSRFSSVTDKVELYVDGASCIFSSIKG